MESPEGRLVRFADPAHAVRGDRHHIGDTLFPAIAVEGVDQPVRGDAARRDRAGELTTGEVAAQQRHISLLGQSRLEKELFKQTPVEPPGLVVKRWGGKNYRAHEIVADGDAGARRAQVEQGAAHHPREDLIDEAQLAGQFAVDLATELPYLTLEVAAEIDRGNPHVADFGHDNRAAAAAENVADAPDGETQNQEAKKDPDEPRLGLLANRLQHEGRALPLSC